MSWDEIPELFEEALNHIYLINNTHPAPRKKSSPSRLFQVLQMLRGSECNLEFNVKEFFVQYLRGVFQPELAAAVSEWSADRLSSAPSRQLLLKVLHIAYHQFRCLSASHMSSSVSERHPFHSGYNEELGNCLKWASGGVCRLAYTSLAH